MMNQITELCHRTHYADSQCRRTAKKVNGKYMGLKPIGTAPLQCHVVETVREDDRLLCDSARRNSVSLGTYHLRAIHERSRQNINLFFVINDQ